MLELHKTRLCKQRGENILVCSLFFDLARDLYSIIRGSFRYKSLRRRDSLTH